MTHPRAPRLNHVAISMPRAALDARGRADILAFYGEVLDWREGDASGEQGDPLILYTGAPGEFLYLLPSDEPLTAPRLDHFGLQVDTLDQLHEIFGRVESYRERDERVETIAPHSRETGPPGNRHVLTGAYFGYLLPLMVELQHFVRAEPNRG